MVVRLRHLHELAGAGESEVRSGKANSPEFFIVEAYRIFLQEGDFNTSRFPSTAVEPASRLIDRGLECFILSRSCFLDLVPA